jgi:probable H4MPT-linked C1 transfer pathway protein
LVDVLGYDIGGANTKAALVSVKNGVLLKTEVAVEYFPIWKQPEKLASVLLGLKEQLGVGWLDGVGVTMTAELSDAYQTKREGVHHILGYVKTAFPEAPIYVLNTDAKLESLDVAKQEPLGVAAANWAATGWLVAQHLKNCAVVDIGSTSTSIIPIINGKVTALGKTDLDKLICGELIYTGSLRTNIAAIVQSIPTRNGVAGVSSELFALSGDVHLALGNISEKEYTSETADGRGKSLPEALARLARVVCADVEMLTRQEIISIAQFIYDKQIRQVESGLTKVYSYTKSLTQDKVPVVVTGLGKDFLARKAAMNINVDSIVDLGTLLSEKAVLATPAFGVALMAANMLEGEVSK